mgnify:CR=1 FL=1
MGHGCHTCGSPNSCECPEYLARAEQVARISGRSARRCWANEGNCKAGWCEEHGGPFPPSPEILAKFLAYRANIEARSELHAARADVPLPSHAAGGELSAAAVRVATLALIEALDRVNADLNGLGVYGHIDLLKRALGLL